MKTPIFFIIIAAFALFGTSCDDLVDGVCENGEGPIETVTLNVPNFDAIVLKNSADVIITPGATQEVKVSGELNIIDLLDTDVDNGVWDIRFTKCVRNMDDMTIYITVPELVSVKVDGSGDITGDGLFTTKNFDAEINGSGDIDMDVDATEVSATIDGSGDLSLGLSADRLFSTIAGSGDLELSGLVALHDHSVRGSGSTYAYEMESYECVVNTAGSGDTKVTVSDKLTVSIDGSGDVYYKGNPSLDVRIDGSGEVIDAN
jgi:hypothetical protein